MFPFPATAHQRVHQVSYRNKKILGYDPSSHTSLRLSGGGGAGKYRQGISTTAITISTTAAIVTTTTIGIDVAADDAVAATAADVAVAATAADVAAATAATAADTVADTGIATSMSPSLVLAGMAPRARVPAGLLGSWVTWWRRLVKVHIIPYTVYIETCTVHSKHAETPRPHTPIPYTLRVHLKPSTPNSTA